MGSKIAEWQAHLKMRLSAKGPQTFDNVFHNIAEYQSYLGKYCDIKLEDAKVLEIGFGARPLRLISMISMGVDAQGVDLDQPVLHGTIREFARMAMSNGHERTLKSLVRYVLFDRRERRELAQVLKSRGNWTMAIPRDRFHVCDATSHEFTNRIGTESLDFIYSEDVFEHIPKAGLEQMTERMATWLRPQGIAIVRPHVYSGIGGSHLTEWYPGSIDKTMERKSDPWEHLRQNRFRANTYLNEFWLADYRSLFERQFDILEERNSRPDMGRHLLVGETAEALKDISDEDLFSNQVLFVLRRKA